MKPSDAANVAVFLKRQIESGIGSPESADSLQRVVDHLTAQITRMNQPLFNPPAFPRDHAQDGHNGMDLRDYFAAKSLQGCLANPGCDYTPMTASAQAQAVADAYGLADAMLKARDA